MHLNLTTEQLERFWSYVDRSDDVDRCWIWRGNVGSSGYGRFGINCGRYLAHRVSYMIFNGHFPDEMFICHTCDNPLCVNPSHLFLGTNQDNIADMVRKGRRAGDNHWTKKLDGRLPSGERHWNSRLSVEDVREIRRRRGMGESLTELGKAFGVSSCYISEVARGKKWSHVK